jgi:hypothetical protein
MKFEIGVLACEIGYPTFIGVPPYFPTLARIKIPFGRAKLIFVILVPAREIGTAQR